MPEAMFAKQAQPCSKKPGESDQEAEPYGLSAACKLKGRNGLKQTKLSLVFTALNRIAFRVFQ